MKINDPTKRVLIVNATQKLIHLQLSLFDLSQYFHLAIL